jgi:hypothetical protein
MKKQQNTWFFVKNYNFYFHKNNSSVCEIRNDCLSLHVETNTIRQDGRKRYSI